MPDRALGSKAAAGAGRAPGMGRRRAILLLAAGAGVPLALPILPRAERGSPPVFAWRGQALGAPAEVLLAHANEAAARRAAALCLSEIARLEAIFSLYREDSQLTRLNRVGRIEAPALELRDLLARAGRFAELSGGAFDPTVQPLWRLYAGAFATRGAPPDARAIAAARASVDYRAVAIGRKEIAFTRPGMAATLNGIAQGYITDRVADLLRDMGFVRLLVALGEVRALDGPAEGQGWTVAIPDPFDPNRRVAELELAGAALATSSGRASRFEASGRYHHLFDPATGASANRHASVSVIAGSATAADALSTALSVLPEEAAPAVLAAAQARALLVAPEGTRRWLVAGA
jgi:thiamine biosynthesis lipoprotein